MRTDTKPRYIKPESIAIGDTVTVAATYQELKWTVTATVGMIRPLGGLRMVLSTGGSEIFTWGFNGKARVLLSRGEQALVDHVTLLHRLADDTAQTLEGM